MITATLVGGSTPPLVQVVVSATPTGQTWVVTGSDGSYSWTVPGGVGVGDGQQLTLVDNRSPGNRPIQYTIASSAGSETSAPVVVPFDADMVVMSLDGQTAVQVEVMGEPLAFSRESAQVAFSVSGRARPVVRYSTTADVVGQFDFLSPIGDRGQWDALLASGEPLLYRCGADFGDMMPAGVFMYGKVSSAGFAREAVRQWSIPYTIVDDPFMDQRLGAFSWDDFDAAFAGGKVRCWSWYSILSSLSGWQASGGSLSQQSGGYSTPNFARVTASTVGMAVQIVETGYGAASAGTGLGRKLVAGEAVTVTARVKGTPGRSAVALIKWDSGTVAAGAAVALTSGWQRVSVTATVPSGVTDMAVGAQMAATGVASGDVLDFSSPTAGPGTAVPVGTFDELFADWDAFDRYDFSTL
jgi:hypothetical protein